MAITEQDKTPAGGAYVSVESMLRLRHYAKDFTLDTHKKSSAILEGDSKTRFRGRGMEFSEVRPYQAGDDVRSIDWRVTARTQKPYTKLFQEERERPVYLAVDQRSPMFFGSQYAFKSVAAAELAAFIGWVSLANNDRIGGLLFGDKDRYDLRAHRGKHAILGLIHQLHAFNQKLNSPVSDTTGGIRLSDMCTEIRRIAKPGSAIFILSDFFDYDADCEEALTMLSRHADVNLVKFYDPLEKTLPANRELTLSNNRERLTVFSRADGFLAQFEQSFKHTEQQLRQLSGRLGARLIGIDCSIPVSQQAQNLFNNPKQRGGARK